MSIRDRIEVIFESWGRFIIRQRWWAIALMFVLTAGLASWLPYMNVDNSGEALLHRDDPERIRYDEFRERFGRDDPILVVVHPPEIFEFGFLEKLRRFHEEIEGKAPYVEEITSLVNARRTYGRQDELVVEDLMETPPETDAELAALRERVSSNPLYENTLISESGTHTAVSIEPFTYSTLGPEGGEIEGFDDADQDAGGSEPLFLTEAEGYELLDALAEIISRYEGPDFEVHLIGGPSLDYRLSTAMTRDQTIFQALSMLICAILLYLLFRRISGIVLPLVVVNAALVASVGIMVWLGIPMSVAIQILPAFLMVVGICDAIHIMVIVYQQLAVGVSKEEAIPFALGHSGLAVVMTSITTAAGLMGFVFAELAPVAQLGIIAPIGVMLAMVYSLVLLPALLAVVRLKPVVAGDARSRRGWTDRFLAWSAELSITHPGRIMTATVLVLMTCLGGMSQLRLSQDPTVWFPESDPFRIALDIVDREFKGASTMEVLIDTGRENGLHEPDTLKRIERAMRVTETLTVGDRPVNKAISIVDVVKETHQALNENRPEFYALPRERSLIAQELLLFENSGSDDLGTFTDSQFRTARMTVRTPWTDAVFYTDFLQAVEDKLTKILGPDVTFEVTGVAPLFTQVLENLIVSMARSYVFALVIITPVLVLLVGNLRRGFAAMIPNLIPVFVVLGIMGLADIPLDASTLMIGGIVIGLAVDDTIHFMHKFNHYYEHTGSGAEAVRRTLATTGSALLFTSLVLVMGFGVFMFAYMKHSFWFGLLSSIATMVAFLADVLVGPALMVLVTRRTKDRGLRGQVLEQSRVENLAWKQRANLTPTERREMPR